MAAADCERLRALQYTTNYKRGDEHQDIKQKTHYTGNNIKSLHLSVAASLKKLRTDYIDILYVHWVSIHFDACARTALTTDR